MPRARNDQTKDEDVSLTIRSTSRKRKLIEYAETQSEDDNLSESPGDIRDPEVANGNIESPTDRRKTRRPSNTKESTSTLRRGKAIGRPKSVLTKRVRTAIKHTDGENGLVEEDEHQVAVESAAKSTSSKSKRKSKATDTQTLDPDLSCSPSPTKPKRKRKTKEEKEAEAMPLAARTLNLKMFVGAHTSIAKGVENSILNARHIGANAFACFLKSQRKWDNPTLSSTNCDAFKSQLLTHSYDATRHIIPHGSYLVNLASPDTDMSAKSYSVFLDDLHRCESLGITYYNFHPGSTNARPLEEAILRLATNLNRALSATTTVVPLLENMASHGNIIGGRFSDLASIISLISLEHKSRVGVCLDTCHAFAAGYDLRSPEAFAATLADFDKVVGMKYLKALHINDSKAPFGAHRDLHQNIGLGFLGLRAFHNVMNEPRFEGLPLILETPCERPDPKDPTGKKVIEDKNVWATEIKLLESLIGMNAEGSEFKALEAELAEKGRQEKEKMQKLFDEKREKERKRAEKESKKEKGQRSLADMFAGKNVTKKGARGAREEQSSSSGDNE